MTDINLLREQQALFEKIRREHWAEQRRQGVKARPRKVASRDTLYMAPDQLERALTFADYNRQQNMKTRPYSWMDTSPYGAGFDSHYDPGY